MKLVNVSEGPVVLDDIGDIVLYDSKYEPYEIQDGRAKRSRSLRHALALRLIVDVTEAMPSKQELEGLKEKCRQRIAAANAHNSSDSAFSRKQAVLVSDEPKLERTPLVEPPKPMETEKAGLDQLSVIWTGPARDAGGFARMNRQFMFGLEKMGMRVKYEDLKSMQDMDPQTHLHIKRLERVSVPSDAIKVYGQTAPGLYDYSRYRMLFTMMETRRLHPMYVDRCSFADEIVVPSKWCKEEFQESGVKRPISVVPLGVDTNIYHRGVEPISFSKSLKPFVFLSVFGWSLRKGYDVLLKAYLEEFTEDDPVTLLISSRFFGCTDESKKKRIRDDVAKVRATVRNPKQPHLVLFGDVLSDQMMPRLYSAASCYILISRGEGFGLPYAEAAACGVPVIGSRYSAQTDFLDDENSYLVDVDGFRSAEKELAWISQFYENAEFPIFGPKSVEQTRSLMRHVFEHQDEAKAKAEKLHHRITTEYTWEAVVPQMYEKIAQVYENRKKRATQ